MPELFPKDQNIERKTHYGLRPGDIIQHLGGTRLYEVDNIDSLDNNFVEAINTLTAKKIQLQAKHCKIVTKVENR